MKQQVFSLLQVPGLVDVGKAVLLSAVYCAEQVLLRSISVTMATEDAECHNTLNKKRIKRSQHKTVRIKEAVVVFSSK